MYKLKIRTLGFTIPKPFESEAFRTRNSSPRVLSFTILGILGVLLNPNPGYGEIWTHESGIRCYSHVSKAISREIGWGPADTETTQWFFRQTLAEYACGKSVADSETVFALELPDSLGPLLRVDFRYPILTGGCEATARLKATVLCKMEAPFIDENIPARNYLISIPKPAKLDSVQVRSATGRFKLTKENPK